MRLTSSTHNHTNLCDGRNTPDEMARAALEAGFTDFGFSGHSYAPFDLDYSVKSEQHYVQELRALQKAYAGRLRIAVGMEADWFAPVNDRAALDYIIGSVHYLRDEATGRYYAVDGAPEALDACVAQMFGGDALDVLVLCSEVLAPLSLVRCYPIGVITMQDQGKMDEKIIAIPFEDPTYNTYRDISELPSHIFSEMRHFFSVYKNLEGKTTVVDEEQGPDEAKRIIQNCLDNYIEKFCR